MSDEPRPAIDGARRLVVVVGPSGAGKDSLLRGWRTADGAPHFAQRVITRAPDATEAHEAVSPGDFAGMRSAGLLATWWNAHGLDYGVRASQLEPLARGGWVVLNGSRAHLPTLRAQAPGLRVVEVTAPAGVLAQRLDARAREDAAGRESRLVRAIQAPVGADLVLVNDGDLRHGVDALLQWWAAIRAL
ncbi:phosphonate metabolism protein/1,5-bisphosphokinase (PRPP-forming) PhnN [Scleromatobacter humisilvae]|uniref:Ribose 1,5-bisphosphate phosphokinase PhnN n=1 Tax=Scleromatobacter humisilvae TaxID=2897159 RepID=A0A9X2C325_9BURK|nr:phosphonate metabolism protein/1,5-bisphosphokinase (PRPP-forming) PhnN [Scleromatobacter humisilvae]MCK9686765.1 phosphonate metabolism protein/1,5-bisphosphokinase (PRPP-forming) PhnN [Scleromatobacter humisilvae]